MALAEAETLAPIELSLVDRPIRIYAIGDSHCLPLRDLILGDELTGRHYIVVAKYIESLSAAKLLQGRKLSREFVDVLEGENLARKGRFSFESTDRADLAISFAAGASGSPPIILITAGDIDLRSAFLPKLNDSFDIVLPFETPYGLNGRARIMPYNVAAKIAAAAMAPLGDTIERLKGMGLPTVFVPTLPPPTLNQERFDTLHGFKCPIDTRYKATIIFNTALKTVCEKFGGIVIDSWPDLLDERAYLRPEFELDGVHLNRSASMLTVRRIISASLGKVYRLNPQRYELAFRLMQTPPSDAQSSDTAALAREFHDSGICRTTVDAGLVEEIASQLDFSLDVGNRHARVDWIGNTVTPFTKSIQAAEPSQAVLDSLYRLMYGAQLAPLMQQCMGGDVWYLSCRPLQSLVNHDEGKGPQAFHTDHSPPHVLRALLYLVDVDDDNGPFEYAASSGDTRRVSGPKGTFFVFDANRLSHRAVPPRTRIRRSIDFVILPRTPSQPRCVMWSGMNNWPADPFQFSINKMRSSPSFPHKSLDTNPLTG